MDGSITKNSAVPQSRKAKVIRTIPLDVQPRWLALLGQGQDNEGAQRQIPQSPQLDQAENHKLPPEGIT